LPKNPPARSRLDAARERMYHTLVFESAEHVFALKGFEAATMQEIASEAGISLKTLYATFPGKVELYAEIERIRGIDFAETVSAAHEAVGDPLGKLAAGVAAYVDFLVQHPDFLRIHLRQGRMWGLEPDEEGARESWVRGINGMAQLLRDGQAGGLFYDGDPELMAMTGIAVMQVQLARYTDRLEQEDAGRLAEVTLLQLQRLLCKPGVADEGRTAA